MKKVLNGAFALVALLPLSLWAGDCSFDKVSAIQAQKSNVLVFVSKEGTGVYWKNIGSYDEKHLDHYQSLAQQSLATGAGVVLRFPEGYDCYTTDYATVPTMLRLKSS